MLRERLLAEVNDLPSFLQGDTLHVAIFSAVNHALVKDPLARGSPCARLRQEFSKGLTFPGVTSLPAYAGLSACLYLDRRVECSLAAAAARTRQVDVFERGDVVAL